MAESATNESPDLDAPGVTTFPTQRAGLHEWARTLYTADVTRVGPRFAAQGYLSAVVRPLELTLKIYEDAAPADLAEVRRLLELRRIDWHRRLSRHVCRDIYPLPWIERYCSERVWFGQTLRRSEVAAHLRAVEDELAEFPNYEIGLLESEELYFNFMIHDGVVLVEGGYEVEAEPLSRIVGGLKITVPEVVLEFRREFDRIWEATTIKGNEVVRDWLRERRLQLEAEPDEDR